jgi:carbon-monoxide dehydrogenase small subunit
MKQLLSLRINGMEHNIAAAPHRTLLEVLREELGYTGTKRACGIGECGACTVIVDGRAVLGCLTLAVAVECRDIVTIEGLEKQGRLDSLQQSFLDHGAIQCGYCSPGMILSAKALLDENPQPSREKILSAIGGNLCRCKGYAKIIEAIEAAASPAPKR